MDRRTLRVLAAVLTSGCAVDGVARAEAWPCEEDGFPCTWEEVPLDVAEKTLDLAEVALDRFTGTAAELAAWLAGQPGVVDATAVEEAVVRLRMEGGRPVFIESHSAQEAGEDLVRGAGFFDATRPAPLHGSLFPPLSTWFPAAPLGVTGRDRNSDQRVNQRDQRKALVLDPMYWEDCYHDLEKDWINLSEDRTEVRDRRRLAREVCDGDRQREGLFGHGHGTRRFQIRTARGTTSSVRSRSRLPGSSRPTRPMLDG